MNAMGLDRRRILIQAYSELGGMDSCEATVLVSSRSGRKSSVRPSGSFALRDARGVFVTVDSGTKGRDTLEALLTAVYRDGRKDEFILELGVHVSHDSIVIERSMPVRAETVIRTQRYRYGGVALVPINAPERVTEWLIGSEGSKGRFDTQIEAESLRVVTGLLRWSRGDTLPVQVLLDESGVVLDVLAPPWRGLPYPSYEEASRFLRRRLTGQHGIPDRLRGQPIKGWVPGTLLPR